ncbi:MAG TPA: hypothetical protein VHA75_20215 [Rugosimonospora sp.]|nr:hypothetical protein [Rugosimonospora sp.]
MTKVVVILILGGVGGWLLAYRTGKAVARAQRAWNDYRSNIKAIRGLWKRTVEMWSTAAKYLGAATAVVVVLIGLLYVAVR